MQRGLAERVLKVLRELPLGTHLCHFYQTPQDMLDVLVPYFAAGLERGEKCLWVVDQAMSVETARQALAQAVPDLEDHIASGQIEFFLHTEWYLRDGEFGEDRVLKQFQVKEQEALAAGYGGLRVTGNTFWARGGHWCDLLEYEQHVDQCFCNFRISAICTYPMEGCSAADVVDVAKAHELVLIRREGVWDIIESATLRQVRQELQESHERLKALAHQMVEVEHRERRRISQVLHDGLQQTIVAARLNLGQVQKRAGADDRAEAIQRIDDLLVEAMRECRTLTTEICPPVLHEGGLVPALQWLTSWFDQQHGLKVHLQASPDEPVLADGERVFLFEAARELLFNVVKHASVENAVVSLVSVPGKVVLQVVDEGVGCDHWQPTADGQGHFGLFSIRERLRMMEGEFAMASAKDQGCRITISLPLTLPAASREEPGTQPGPAPREQPARRRQAAARGLLRVLLADDHAILRQGLARLLNDQEEIEVVGEAGDGLEAVEMTRRLEPDVVLMDITMPKMNGIEATRQIRQHHPEVRVIGLSMHDQPRMVQSMMAAGAEAYLQKNGRHDELVSTILGQAASPAQDATQAVAL